MIIYISVFIFLSIGLMALTGGYPHIQEKLKRRAMQYNTQAEKVMTEEDIMRLGAIDKFILHTDHKLDLIGKKRSYLLYRSILLYIGGIFIGVIFFEDISLAMVLGICATPISFLMLLLKSSTAVRLEEEELRSAMSIITGAYRSRNDIVGAIQEYVKNKNQGKKSRKISGFEKFLAKDTFFSASIPGNLALLGEEYNNIYFKEWCRMLILCQKDHRLRFYALEPIILEMADEQNFQIEKDSVMKDIWTEYLIVVAILFAIIPAFKLLHYDWYLILTTTTGGKICIFMIIISSLIAGILLAYSQGLDVKKKNKKNKKEREEE